MSELVLNLSSTFLNFWAEYGPNNKDRLLPPFEIIQKKLNGPFGRRLPRPNHPKGWLIELDKDLSDDIREVTLAHEILHLALDFEGYPIVGTIKGVPDHPAYDSIAADLHGALVHPIIWHRLRQFNFPITNHILVQSTGQLHDLRNYKTKFPSRKDSPKWESWVLKYINARLDWADKEREEIFNIFKKRHSSIGDNGEKILSRLYALGYNNPEQLTPETVLAAGKMVLQRLKKLDGIFVFNWFKTIKIPG